MPAEIVSLAERRQERDLRRAQTRELILWAPPLFWWEVAMRVWAVALGRHDRG